MTVRANFQKNYLMRYLILAGVCLFLAAWFAYDGFIGYPRQLTYAREYGQLADLEPPERQAKWKEISAERGWSGATPEKEPAEIEDDIKGQYVWAFLNLVVGVPALLLYLRSRGSWVEATDTGLKTSWGQTVDFSKVTKLNKKKWSDKGIAKASYSDRHGQKVFVFDDFKYEREPLGRMLRELESQLTPEQIVGGPPEKPAAETEPSADAANDTEVGQAARSEAEQAEQAKG